MVGSAQRFSLAKLTKKFLYSYSMSFKVRATLSMGLEKWSCVIDTSMILRLLGLVIAQDAAVNGTLVFYHVNAVIISMRLCLDIITI